MRIFGSVDTFIEAGAQDLRLGRLVANAQFLKALIAHGRFDSFQLFCPTVAQVRMLERVLAEELGALAQRRRIELFTHLHLPQHLAQTSYAAFHVGGWGLSLPRLAYLRARIAEQTGRCALPITGVTHSLHTADIFTKMREIVSAPFSACDAVICTSTAAQAVMERHMAEAVRRAELEGGRIIGDKLRFPRIPLAVAEEAFTVADRGESRRALGWRDDEVVALYLGRLSPYSKADLHPMLYALAELGRGDRARPLLCLAGGGDAANQAALRETARELGIADRLQVQPNVTDAEKRQLLGGADIFISPIDNYQETFGLAVLEAMAAGLPVVASDFDGYRDLIDDAVTGFRIPTRAARLPPATLDLVGLLDYNLTAFLMAQTVALDSRTLLARLRQLIDDPSLRRRMGEAGRTRARSHFSWPAVIRAYEGLWEELAASAAAYAPPRGLVDPQVGDLHAIFASYPTAALAPGDRFVLSDFGRDVHEDRAPAPALHSDLLPLVDPELGAFALAHFAAPEGATLASCAAAATAGLDIPPAYTELQVIWLLKQGLITEPTAR